jgi:selenide,water dikinase
MALRGLELIKDPNVIVGLEDIDDAGVYRLSDKLALIQTIDYFTPIVDDPYTFGQIAAANALSDVYAMGGKPITALNVVCFPSKTMDLSVLRKILEGGIKTLGEAEVVLIGGHSVEDKEIKYGLSVTGTINPDLIVTKGGAKPGDNLILTKPLGTGIINTAIKAKMASDEAIEKVTNSMKTLNKDASHIMQAVGVNGCTDITGFGLLGHACEMVDASGIGMLFNANSIPVFSEAKSYAQSGLVPGGTERNKKFRNHQVNLDPNLPPEMTDILFDPQTSGGLLISVPSAKAFTLLDKLQDAGIQQAVIIGEVLSDPKGIITVK